MRLLFHSEFPRLSDVFMRFLALVKNCKLFIHNHLFEIVLLVEKYSLSNSFHYNYISPEEESILKSYQISEDTDLGVLFSDSKNLGLMLISVQEILEFDCKIKLSNQFKQLLIQFYSDANHHVDTNSVMELFNKIPKFQRIPIGFFIDHLKR